MRHIAVLIGIVAVAGCGNDDEYYEELYYDTVRLTVENRTGYELWFFQYSDCGRDQWTEVIALDEYVPSGADVSQDFLTPGCYDLYVEDENGCHAEHTSGNLPGGNVFTWTVRAVDLSTICL